MISVMIYALKKKCRHEKNLGHAIEFWKNLPKFKKLQLAKVTKSPLDLIGALLYAYTIALY